MKKGKNWNQRMIYGIVMLLVVYSGFRIKEWQNVEWKETMLENLGQWMLDKSEQIYFPGLTYAKDYSSLSIPEQLLRHTTEVFPIVGYLDRQKSIEIEVEDYSTRAMILERQANDENTVDANGNLVGEPEPVISEPAVQNDLSMEKLNDFEYLLGTFYTVDGTTMTGPEELNAEVLLGEDVSIDTSTEGPKVLIYHTHSQEDFIDSVSGDESTTIVGMGSYLTELLNEKGIATLHHEGVYDLIDGKLDRSKAYQLAEPEIYRILEEHPSIEVVIDLHRDGVAQTTHLVTGINGKETAQIMFFNGLSRTKQHGDIAYLHNPYIQDNLAISLQLQLMAARYYPGFTRHIYLKGYRYNMHLKPKSLLIEAGAQTNTVSEMRNAMEVLAELLDLVLTP